jgi:hypothetical protein
MTLIEKMTLAAMSRLRVSIEANTNYQLEQMRKSWEPPEWRRADLVYGGSAGAPSRMVIVPMGAIYVSSGSGGSGGRCSPLWLPTNKGGAGGAIGISGVY